MKFKKCCLDQQNRLRGQWAEQRDASETLLRDMMDFASEEFEGEMVEAWLDFCLTDDLLEVAPDENEGRIFMPYFLFHWDSSRPRSGKGALRRGGVVSRRYAAERGNRMPELQRKFLEQAMTQPMSFFEVLWSRPKEGMGLRDILIGRDFDVAERLGSQTTRRGDILYGQVWEVDGLCTMGCTAPICIPPKCKAEVIELRGRLRRKIVKQSRPLEADDLFRWADLVRLTYLEIRDRLYEPPEFQNTDGEPLEFHVLSFRIESAAKAFEALAPLAAGRTKDEILADAKIGEAGELESVRFDWLKRGNKKFPTWENTILGNIKIEGRSLLGEVNSGKRAAKLRTEIGKRMGDSAVFQSDEVKPLDKMLEDSRKREKSAGKSALESSDEILRDPEIRKHMVEHIQRQVDAWAYERLPILKGLTPMQAVADPEGREIVESLLIEWERRIADEPAESRIRPDLSNLRRTLNLGSPGH